VRSPDFRPVRLVRVPRWAWLMACSLVVLGVGSAVYAVRRARFWFAGGVLLALIGAGAAAVFWPQPFVTFVAATPPGILVLACVLTLAWVLQRRYQRRVVFMPGFSRARPASSQNHAPGSSLRRRQPSTVDAPPAG